MKIQDEISAEGTPLLRHLGTDLKKNEVFCVPQGYFQKFPEQMLELITAMNASLPEFEDNKINPYTVPESYFELLDQQISKRIKAMLAVVDQAQYSWDDTDKKNPFSVPNGYFEHWDNQIMQLILDKQENASTEIASLSPLLAGLKKEQPFSVPQDYFNQNIVLPTTPIAKVVEHPSVRSIKWARWAAAASVLLIFALGGWQFLGPANSGLGLSSFERSLANVPDAKIKEWLSNNMDEEDVNGIRINLAGINTIATHTSLNNFSEKEIKDYLESEIW